VFFWVVTPAVWTRETAVCSPEDGDSMFLRNVGIYLQVHTAGVSTQKNRIDIFTAVRTSNLTCRRLLFVSLPALFLFCLFSHYSCLRAVLKSFSLSSDILKRNC
jgi:hypothetical protein